MPIDMSLASTTPPPRKTTSGASARRTTKAQPQQQDTRTVTDRRAEGLMGLGQLGQGLCMLFGNYADAAAIGTHVPNIAPEFAKLGETNDFIAKGLDFLIDVGPYGGLVAVTLPFVLQIAANHKWINAGMLAGQGVVAPEVLDAKMRADMSRMQAEAARAQQQALIEAQKAQEEYERTLMEAVA